MCFFDVFYDICFKKSIKIIFGAENYKSVIFSKKLTFSEKLVFARKKPEFPVFFKISFVPVYLW